MQSCCESLHHDILSILDLQMMSKLSDNLTQTWTQYFNHIKNTDDYCKKKRLDLAANANTKALTSPHSVHCLFRPRVLKIHLILKHCTG